MTFRILTDDTRQIIDRSLVRPVTPEAPNQRADMAVPPDPGEPTEYVQSNAGSNGAPSLKLIDYSDLIGRSFLLDTNEDGERLRVRVQEIVDAVEDHEYSTIKARDHV